MTARETKKKELWIGLAHVEQPNRNGVLGDADQAYVNVIAVAATKPEFRSQIKKAVNELGLLLIRVEDAETMIHRLSKHGINEELQNLAEEVKHTGSLRFGTFHTFDLNHSG